MPPARNVGRSSGRVRWWAYGLPYPASGRRSHPCRAACLLLDRCATAPETRPLPAVSLAHPARDVNRLSLSSDVRQGEAVIPGPSSGGRWPLRFPGHAPPYPPPAVLGAPLPAMLIVRRRWGPVIGRERRRVRPVIAPPPFAPPPAIHAGKSTYSGEIESLDRDPGIATLVPGMRFPGN